MVMSQELDAPAASFDRVEAYPSKETDYMLSSVESFVSEQAPRVIPHNGDRRQYLTPIAFVCKLLLALALGLFVGWRLPVRKIENSQIAASPFSGAFSMIPTRTQTTSEFQRFTLIAMWTKNTSTTYLRHFFYTAQLNADVMDLLFVNRKIDEGDECLDLPALGINIPADGNIKVVCMDQEEWKQRHVNVLCSAEHGWACTSQQRREVYGEFRNRRDERNYHWRPIKGHAFRDLFKRPQDPLWGWVDVDTFLGRMTRFPFNVMSKMSIMSISWRSPQELFMAGQLTVFNFRDENLSTAWKSIPSLQSAEAFTKHTHGVHPEEAEELIWSYYYMDLKNTSAGSRLNYTLLPLALGDDQDIGKGSGKQYAISGRDVMLVDLDASRESIERLVLAERSLPLDNLGDIGWTAGIDGSDMLLQHPDMRPAIAVRHACKSRGLDNCHYHSGVLESTKVQYGKACDGAGWWIPDGTRVCVPLAQAALGVDGRSTSSIVHLSGQRPGYLFRKTESVTDSSKHDRRLLKHFHWSKGWGWWTWPSFVVDEDSILVMSESYAYVFKTGKDRAKNVWSETNGVKSP